MRVCSRPFCVGSIVTVPPAFIYSHFRAALVLLYFTFAPFMWAFLLQQHKCCVQAYGLHSPFWAHFLSCLFWNVCFMAPLDLCKINIAVLSSPSISLLALHSEHTLWARSSPPLWSNNLPVCIHFFCCWMENKNGLDGKTYWNVAWVFYSFCSKRKQIIVTSTAIKFYFKTYQSQSFNR